MIPRCPAARIFIIFAIPDPLTGDQQVPMRRSISLFLGLNGWQLAQVGILIVIPALLALRFTTGERHPFWDANYDPNYAYLFNGLNLAETGGNIPYFGHPGTTVQEINAVLIKVIHVFRNTPYDSITDVLRNPEVYLKGLAYFYTWLNILLVFLLGITALRCTGEWSTALLFQCGAFIARVILLDGFYQVKPEPLLFATVVVLMIVFLIHTTGKGLVTEWKPAFARRIFCTGHGIPVYVFAYAFLAGFALVTKMTSFPIVLLPMIVIPGKMNRLVFLFLTSLVFLILTIPIWELYPQLFRWVASLLFHSGPYGKGPAQMIDPGMYQSGVFRMVQQMFVLPLVMTVSAAVLAWCRVRRQWNRDHMLLLALLAVQLTGTAVILKNYQDRYLIPVLLTLPASVYLLYGIAGLQPIARTACSLLLVAFLAFSNLMTGFTGRHIAVETKTENGAVNILTSGCSHPAYARYYGSMWSGYLWADRLASMYDPILVNDPFRKSVRTWNRDIRLDSLTGLNRPVIFFGRTGKLAWLKAFGTFRTLDNNKYLFQPSP